MTWEEWADELKREASGRKPLKPKARRCSECGVRIPRAWTSCAVCNHMQVIEAWFKWKDAHPNH